QLVHFFFQAEDGIRDRSVTGVQTCALPISSSKPPVAAAPAAAKKSDKPGKSDTDSAKNAPDQPKWDPLRAEKDIEVAEHYMHIGDYDAAIDRLEDAIDSKPGYAIPFRYLGEAQEKKGLKKRSE